MKNVLGLTVLGASILAVVAPPTFARTMKGERMHNTQAGYSDVEEQNAPVALRDGGSYQSGPTFGWTPRLGADVASSPYKGGGY